MSFRHVTHLNELPKDVILLICDYLSCFDFFRFRLINRKIYSVSKIQKERKIQQLILYYPKQATKYIIKNERFDMINRFKSDFSIDCLFYYSIFFDKLDILKILYIKYDRPQDLLFTALYHKKYEIADWLHSINSIIEDERLVELIVENKSILSWIKGKYFNRDKIKQAIIFEDKNYLISHPPTINIKHNDYMILAYRIGNIEIFKLLEDIGYLNPKNLFLNICKVEQENLEAIYYLYVKGYEIKNKYSDFFHSESEKFIKWMIKNNIKYEQFTLMVKNFDLENINIFYNNGSKTALSYFYFNADREKMEIALDRGIITSLEFKQRFK